MRNLLLTLSVVSTLTFSWNSVLNSTFIQHRNALQPSSNATNPVTSTLPLFNNNDHSNADVKLTAKELKNANDQIVNTLKKDVVNYFQTNDSDIGIKDDDFIITNLQVDDNLFNQQQGKNIVVTITAATGQYRISNSLSSINIIVHGKNTDFINSTIKSDPNTKFSLDGIHQVDHEDTNVLQDGNHNYDQPKLLTKLVGDQDPNSQISKSSVLGTIKNNSYNVDASSFTGNISISYSLENDLNAKTVSLAIDTNAISHDVGSENNFWDVLTKTKMIWLQTTVVHSGNDRTLNTVSLVFTPSTDPDDQPLCVFDLSNPFAGESISNPATLAFPDFQFVINYQQMS